MPVWWEIISCGFNEESTVSYLFVPAWFWGKPFHSSIFYMHGEKNCFDTPRTWQWLCEMYPMLDTIIQRCVWTDRPSWLCPNKTGCSWHRFLALFSSSIERYSYGKFVTCDLLVLMHLALSNSYPFPVADRWCLVANSIDLLLALPIPLSQFVLNHLHREATLLSDELEKEEWTCLIPAYMMITLII